MKQFCLLIVLLSLAIAASAQNPAGIKLDFAASAEPIDQVLLRLSQESGVEITFSNDILPPGKEVTISLPEMNILEILDRLLAGTGLAYQLIANRIVLVRKQDAPSRYTIKGTVRDRETGETLISASVYIPGTTKGTTTNSYGFFSLTLPEGEYALKVSYLGYQSIEMSVLLRRDKTLDIDLSSSLTLTPVVVTASDSLPYSSNVISTENIPLGRFETLPALGGEVDVIRLTHLLSGVQTGADGVGGIHIRGGGADQNLILLDGIPVYNAAHMAGVFSIFNSSAVKSARLIKGSFPARFGGRLSSVLDVRTKEGNKKRLGAEATIGLTSAKVSVEGPIKKDTSSFIFSARQSFLGAFIRPISRRSKENNNQGGESDYHFYDLNGKVNFSVGNRDELFLSVYKGGDQYDNETTSNALQDGLRYRDTTLQNLSWGNTLASIRWNHIIGSKMFVNTTLSYSQYYFESDDLFTYVYTNNDLTFRELTYSRFESNIKDYTANVDFEYSPSVSHFLRFGLSITRHSFKPGVASINSDVELTINNARLLLRFLDSLDNQPIKTIEYAAYLEDDIRLSDKLRMNLGLRTSTLSAGDKNYFSFEPRLAVTYNLRPRLSLKASFSQMKQYLHLLTTSGVGLPNDLWVPSTDRVGPQSAWQVVGGFNYKAGDFLVLDVEGYYKKMKDVITFQEGSSITFIDAENWENSVTAGEGWSYGLEIGLSGAIGATTGWINYTLAWSERQFEEVNLGRRYPFRYDRRHDLKMAFVHRLSDRWNISGNWVFGTGIAITLPISEYVFDIPSFSPTIALNFGERNSLRLPAYHRLDLGANYRFGRKSLNQELSFGIYNITNAQNPLYYRLSRDPRDIRERSYVQATLLPFVPYFSYSIGIGE